MKTGFIIFLLSLTMQLSAQTDSSYMSTEVDNMIYTLDFSASKEMLLRFIHENKIKVIDQNESRMNIFVKIILNYHDYQKFDSLMSKLGYSNSKKINTTSDLSKFNDISLELNYLRKKKASYDEILSKFDDKTENYITLWNELKLTEEKIFEKERELLNLNNKENTYTVSVNLYDETRSPEYTGVSFVNMPGIEYSYLNIESPKDGISGKNYQGYLLKYLFTKGKSFATIGVYKNSGLNKSDTTAFSELFILGFGQDFYSRYLGRGTRRFLNLYTGYTIGGVMASGKTTKENMFYLSPTIGLELFKNKYFLIDSKVNYFVPFKYNQNLRGWSCNLSFNFVF